MSPSQQHHGQLLSSPTSADDDAPLDIGVHELFARQAVQRPHAIAVDCGRELLTYGDLERRANRLARYLRGIGVGPETIVGLALEASLDAIVGILAILKAGGAYFPLDLGYPSERIAFMLGDAKPEVVLCSASVAKKLPACAARLVALDATADAIAGEESSAISAASGPENLAYLIYTSGSTGQPKGVLLEHRGLTNMALCHARTFGVGPGSRVLQFSSLCFDASVSEIFMTLVAGATLCLASRQERTPGSELIATLRRLDITNVLLPPSALAVLPDADLPHLETLIAGGERCSAALVKRWAPGRRFFNAYGPTETTVTATMWLCSEEDDRDPPIGLPRENATLHVFDDELKPVRDGAVGELHVGGIGLARGYLNRPALTAENFVMNPRAENGAARLYKTGDMVRCRDDGAIEFVGRIDRQVKVRGFRVELGEIEACLQSHPRIERAAVRDFQEPHVRLVAYYVPNQAAELDSRELRSWLADRLPDYMLPVQFVALDALPVSAAGKLDYAALAPPSRKLDISADHDAPRTATEASLARIWRDVLGLDAVGIHDPFVVLGGDSLLSVQVALRAVKEGLDLTSSQVLAHPTIAELAAELDAAGRIPKQINVRSY
ncbi:MAG: non-ribosomal peptide synthetase [Planctomycetota bacterium]